LVTPESPGTAFGSARPAKVPSPSCPLALLPQQATEPSRVIAQVCFEPAASDCVVPRGTACASLGASTEGASTDGGARSADELGAVAADALEASVIGPAS